MNHGIQIVIRIKIFAKELKDKEMLHQIVAIEKIDPKIWQACVEKYLN